MGFTSLDCQQNSIWQSCLKERRAAIKSCVCWTGHHPQMLIPLSSCQQLLSAKICHLDCLCYTVVKIKRACINNMIISRSMLIWLIWSQMTLLHRRGSSDPCVEKTLHSTSTYQNSHLKRAFRFTARHCPALFEGCKLRCNGSWTQLSGMSPAQLPGIAWMEGGEGSFYENLHHCFVTSAWEDKKPPESERHTLKLT